MKPSAALPALACVFAAFAAGCSSESADPGEPTSNAPFTALEATGTTEPTQSAEPTYRDVPPESFLTPENQDVVSFDTPIAGTNYFCMLGESGVACVATAPDEVPNLEDMPGTPWGPFTGRPGAVFLDHAGTTSWGILEGFPYTNPDARLKPGERVEFKGGWCQVPNPDAIECGAGGEAFSVTGPDRTYQAL